MEALLYKLAQTLELVIKIAERLLQQREIARAGGGFELAQYPVARQGEVLFSLMRAACSGVSRCFAVEATLAASACCASTDLLSQPRAIFRFNICFIISLNLARGIRCRVEFHFPWDEVVKPKAHIGNSCYENRLFCEKFLIEQKTRL